MDQLLVAPNGWLSTSSGKQAEKLFPLASRFLVAERVWLDTTPLVSLICRERILSNVWWSVKAEADEAEEILALWINSTPGFLLFLSELEVTRGGWAAIKKRSLENLPVLYCEKLEEAQRKKLLELFGQLRSQHFPLLKEQLREGKEGRGLRFQLDSQLLSTLAGRCIGKDDLAGLYSLLLQESMHWESAPYNPREVED